MGSFATGLSFFLGRAPTFSRLGFERRRLDRKPVEADFGGQVWLVTGASGGLGREIALQAAGRGATVIALARSETKLASLRGDASEAIETLATDLSLIREVRAAAGELSERFVRVDVLVNNVGVLLDSFVATGEGFETSFATNLLNHYLLTELLIENDLLQSGGFVINMSSGGMYTAPLDLDVLNVTDAARHDGMAAYACHKRAQVELTRHWNAKYGPEITFHVMHPGWVDTEGLRTSLPAFRAAFAPLLRTPEQGADTAIWLAAERPAAAAEGIWLDRELQPEHLSDATRTGRQVREDLVAALDAWTRQDSQPGGGL